MPVAGDEIGHLALLHQFRQKRFSFFALFRMNVFQDLPVLQVGSGIPQGVFPGRVQALDPAVPIRDQQQVGRNFEAFLHTFPVADRRRVLHLFRNFSAHTGNSLFHPSWS